MEILSSRSASITNYFYPLESSYVNDHVYTCKMKEKVLFKSVVTVLTENQFVTHSYFFNLIPEWCFLEYKINYLGL